MMIGPPSIGRCPSCQHPFKSPGIQSGDMTGATIWPDGQVVGPMWPFSSPIGICPYCRETLCYDEIIDEDRAAWVGRFIPVRYIKPMTYQKCRRTLEKNQRNNEEKEIILSLLENVPGESPIFFKVSGFVAVLLIVFVPRYTSEKLLAIAACIVCITIAFLAAKIRTLRNTHRDRDLACLDVREETSLFYHNLKRLYELVGGQGDRLRKPKSRERWAVSQKPNHCYLGPSNPNSLKPEI